MPDVLGAGDAKCEDGLQGILSRTLSTETKTFQQCLATFAASRRPWSQRSLHPGGPTPSSSTLSCIQTSPAQQSSMGAGWRCSGGGGGGPVLRRDADGPGLFGPPGDEIQPSEPGARDENASMDVIDSRQLPSPGRIQVLWSDDDYPDFSSGTGYKTFNGF